MYRYHIVDDVFNRSIRVTIEHGHNNHRSDDWSSTAYWYQTEPPQAPSPPVERLPRPDKEWERSRLTDVGSGGAAQQETSCTPVGAMLVVLPGRKMMSFPSSPTCGGVTALSIQGRLDLVPCHVVDELKSQHSVALT